MGEADMLEKGSLCSILDLDGREFRMEEMQACDMDRIISFYMDYFNTYEGGEWTEETVSRRIWQVYGREDSLCMILWEQGRMLAFALGYFEQFDDGMVYELVEIVVSRESQNQGIGTMFMAEIERYVKEKGAILIQLKAVNDEMHEHFYGKLGFGTVRTQVLKCKVL